MVTRHTITASSNMSSATAVIIGSLLFVALAHCQPIVGQPPMFTHEPNDTYVFESGVDGQPTTLMLHCGASGDPAPSVTWFRSGVEVNSSLVLESGTLSIVNITEGQSASREGIPYYCTATNTLGTIRSRTVKVFYAFFDGIAAPTASVSVNVTVDQDVALLCDIPSAMPPPVIEWWNDAGVLLTSSTVRYLNEGQYLYLHQLTEETINRIYHCRVTNALLHNTVQSSGNYTLNNLGTDFPSNSLVTYKGLETETTALVGETVQFSFVSATLANPFLTEYRINGLNVGVVTMGPLGVISNVALPEDGKNLKYNVTLTVLINNRTIVYSSTLTVYEPAVISSTSANDLDQFVGDPLSFFCRVAGAPAPDVVWYFNGERLTPSDGLTINGGTINIPSPTTAHSGMYQCFVSNIVNTVHTAIALQVREPVAPVVTGLPQGQDRCHDVPTYTVPMEESFILFMNVTADPCPTVEWRVDGKTLAEVEESTECNMTFYSTDSCSDFTGPPTGSYTFTIAISNVTDCTTGHYTITLSNRAGTVTSDPVFVTPEVPVRAVGVQIQNSMCLRDNMNETIVCEVEGYPYPGINFVKDNNPLETVAGRVTLNDCEMVLFAPVISSDEGLYSCTAQNVVNGEEVTSTSDSVVLLYCTLPQVVELVPPGSLHEGEDLVSTCTVSGTPPPEITWLKDGVPLSNDDDRITIGDLSDRQSRLEITRVTKDDSGDYTCMASNLADIDVVLRSFNAVITAVLSTGTIIGIAVGVAIGALTIVMVILLYKLCSCWYRCMSSCHTKVGKRFKQVPPLLLEPSDQRGPFSIVLSEETITIPDGVGSVKDDTELESAEEETEEGGATMGHIPFTFDDVQVMDDGHLEYEPHKHDKKTAVDLSFGTIQPKAGNKFNSVVYDMKQSPHGLCLIINNKMFLKLSNREGTEIDEENLVQTFRFLGYKVIVHRDCTVAQMKDIFEEIRSLDHSIHDSFVCCMLTHGEEGILYGSDSKCLDIATIVSKLNADNCKTLAGKPKLFFLQSSRGRRSNPIANTHDADFFFGYATPPGKVSLRDVNHGSWYVTEVCRSLCTYATYTDLIHMVQKANNEVETNYHFEDYEQTPEFTSVLNKDVYFF